MSFLFSFFIAAFLCSIPFGLVISTLFYDLDPRKHHSKNIGMSNTWRCCGASAGLTTLFFDMNKATLSLFFASILAAPYMEALGFFCVFFHCFSIYLNGKGGKGVASSAGVLLFFSPYVLCTGACTWIVFRFIYKKASVASLVATIAVFIHTILYVPNLIFCISSVAILIIVRHKENMIRLQKKQERYF